MSKILIVEDDVFLRDGLCEILSKENYTVTVASTVSQAKKFIDTDSFNLLIFDVMLPDGNGFDLCMSVREKDSNIPILFLTACDDEVQVVRGLDAGADDYVTKPFSPKVLVAKVKALLKRTREDIDTSSQEYNGLVINKLSKEVKVNDVVKVMVNGNRIQGKVIDIDHNIITVVIQTYYGTKDIIFVKDKMENVEKVVNSLEELAKVRGISIR